MDWLSLRAGHLITSLCARILQSTKEDNDMTRIKSETLNQERSIESMIRWVDGTGTRPLDRLPDLTAEPIPTILQKLTLPHSERPLGSTAMLHISGARARLKDMRVGAWTIAPHCEWRYIKAPTGSVEWVPKSLDLPGNLFVPYTNAL
jgi:hypothetical protein